MKNLSLALIVILSTTVVKVSAEEQVVEQCVCEPISWQEAFDKSKHVAFGEIKDITQHGESLASAPFTLIQTYKGNGAHVTKIVGAAEKGDACHSKLVAGNYIAYAGDSHTVVLNACSASRRLLKDELVSVLVELQKYAEEESTIPIDQYQTGNVFNPIEKEKDLIDEFWEWWNSWSLF